MKVSSVGQGSQVNANREQHSLAYSRASMSISSVNEGRNNIHYISWWTLIVKITDTELRPFSAWACPTLTSPTFIWLLKDHHDDSSGHDPTLGWTSDINILIFSLLVCLSLPDSPGQKWGSRRLWLTWEISEWGQKQGCLPQEMEYLKCRTILKFSHRPS